MPRFLPMSFLTRSCLPILAVLVLGSIGQCSENLLINVTSDIAYKANDLDEYATGAVCRAMAGEGWVVAAVNYRLSPKAKFPAYIEDGAASVAWMKKNGKKYGGDPSRVFVAGHSAGGYLAAMVALDERYLAAHGMKTSELAGSIPIAGQMMTHYTVREERGLPKTRIIADEAAPINHVRESAPRMLILYAENDMALRGDENRYFAAALAEAGNDRFSIHEIAGQDHGGIGDRIAEPESPVRKLMAEFVRPGSAKKAPEAK
jgi:acetyl esterase/lipase